MQILHSAQQPLNKLAMAKTLMIQSWRNMHSLAQCKKNFNFVSGAARVTHSLELTRWVRRDREGWDKPVVGSRAAHGPAQVKDQGWGPERKSSSWAEVEEPPSSRSFPWPHHSSLVQGHVPALHLKRVPVKHSPVWSAKKKRSPSMEVRKS